MEKKDMLDKTKTILEKMSESEEKVSHLREDLNENCVFFQQIERNLMQLRELRNQNTVELEVNHHLKDNIKTFNQQLLNFAQVIYQYNHELYSELKLHETELVRNEELLYKNKEMLKEKRSKYEVMQITLSHQLELLEKEERDSFRKKELESNTLTVENEEIETEIKMLGQEIEQEKNYIQTELTALDDEKLCKKTVQDLQESVQCKKNELKQYFELLEEVRRFGEKLGSEGEQKLCDLDRQIQESQIEVDENSSIIVKSQLSIDEVSNQTEIIVEQIKTKEEECDSYESEVNGIKANLKVQEDEYNNKMVWNETSILEIDEKCKQQTQLQEQIKADILVFKSKINGQQGFIRKITEFLAHHKPNDNLSRELAEREEKKKQLKATHRQLKNEHDKRVLEVEAQLNRGQTETDARETINKKLQEDTETLILELNRLKTEHEEMLMEKEKQEKELQELAIQMKNLNCELAQTRKESLKKTKTSQTSARYGKEKRMKIRNWDSDSSVESDDRRLSDVAKKRQ